VYSYIGTTLPPHRFDLYLDPGWIKPTKLEVHQVSHAVEKQKCRHTPYAIAGCQLASHPAASAQPQHYRLSAKVTLEPVDDRLGQEAGASGV